MGAKTCEGMQPAAGAFLKGVLHLKCLEMTDPGNTTLTKRSCVVIWEMTDIGENDYC
jgi:hypothetical protein